MTTPPPSYQERTITVYRTEDGYTCPDTACGKQYMILQSLKKHCKDRHHGMKIRGRIQPLTIEEKKERKRKYDADYREAHAKRKRSAKSKHPREPYDFDDADARGVHGAEEPLVYYAKSKIPDAGNGVFANEDLKIRDIVTWYAGELSLEPDSNPEYTIQIGRCYLNGIRTPEHQEGLGSFINRAMRKHGMRKNCEFVTTDNGSHPVYIEVIKDIKKGEELYTTYGRSYRIGKHTQT